MKRAAIYCRISDDREGREVGVSNQEDACRKRAVEQGWTVVEVFTDNDKGASTRSKKKRPNYDRLLKDAQCGRFDALIAYSTSRLTRRPLQLEDWLTLAEGAKLKAIFLTGPAADWSSPQGRAIARTLAAWDASEAETTGDRVSFRFEADARKGKRHGGPIGFGWTPSEATAVKEATNRVIRGEATILGLTREWTAAGFKPLRGGVWHPYAVRRILMRPANAGLATYRGEVLTDEEENYIKGDWKPIITVDQWKAVCGVLKDPDRKTMKSNKARWLMTNLAKCSLCGSPMRSASVGTPTKRYYVYRCRDVASCGKQSINQKIVDSVVTGAVVYDYFRHPETSTNPDAVDSQIFELNRQLAEIAASRGEFAVLVRERAMTARQVFSDLNRLNKEELEVNKRITHLIANNAHASMVSEARNALFASTTNPRGPSMLSRGAKRVVDDLFARFARLPLADQRRLIDDRFTIKIEPFVQGESSKARVVIRSKRTDEEREHQWFVDTPVWDDGYSFEMAHERYLRDPYA